MLSGIRCPRLPLAVIGRRNYVLPPLNHNQAIIDMLRGCREDEAKRSDKNAYKLRAFDTAIKALTNLDHPLRSAAEALSLRGVGSGIAGRIGDFLETNDTADEPAYVRKEIVEEKAREELEHVHGIGRAVARRLVDAGCMSVADLHSGKYSHMLTHAQRVGIKYYDHINQSVSRQESETVAEFIRTNCSSKYEVIITGSYRRGAPDSSYIDIILLNPNHVYVPVPSVSPPTSTLRPRVLNKTIRAGYISADTKASSPLHSEIVPALQERGLIATYLSSGVRKWQGIVRVPEKNEEGRWLERSKRLSGIEETTGSFRRLDLNLIPMKSRGAALLALTGDSELNRDLRHQAVKLGMHLNEFGLWRWNSDNFQNQDEAAEADEVPTGFWQLVRATTEEEIFERLGLEYIEPEKRDLAPLHKGEKPLRASPLKS